MLVEGWNKGWDASATTGSPGAGTSASRKPYPDFDIAELARYAPIERRAIIGHHETAGNIAQLREAARTPRSTCISKLGIHAVKTGYVADAGGIQALGADGKIHFEWHEGQVMVNHHLKVVTEAAKRHISDRRA